MGLYFILQNGNQSLCTEDLLSSCFSQLILTEGANLDYESLLQFYLDLSEEWREETKEGFDPALKPNIPLTTEAIQALVTNIGNCWRQRCCLSSALYISCIQQCNSILLWNHICYRISTKSFCIHWLLSCPLKFSSLLSSINQSAYSTFGWVINSQSEFDWVGYNDHW